ncbi:hypothetical protein [Burkholderia sp. Z1]|uniref:hypothetical protein n=1 Tax=Burkholderia sp. Z1 TaxID=2759039 RepID=UPI001865D7F1|nr:hypothetical protein [Burkholderia sp. Z1]
MAQLSDIHLSTEEPCLDLSPTAPSETSCVQIFTRPRHLWRNSWTPIRFPFLTIVQPVDTPMVRQPDRLGWSVDHLNPYADGPLKFQMRAALAKFERAGMSAAHRRGPWLGHPAALTPDQVEAFGRQLRRI